MVNEGRKKIQIQIRTALVSHQVSNTLFKKGTFAHSMQITSFTFLI